ncbi:MAG: glycosyltransferase family 2 protein [Promethearchaeota archaeon]
MPLVSVILPSYNHADYISETIESVLNQTFKDLELIIIDDCSPDNSREIIENYGKKDDRVRILFHDVNKGIALTQNEAIERAKGKYIAFLNSDDVWEKTKLEKQVKILEKDENLIVWTDVFLIDNKSKVYGKRWTKSIINIKTNGDLLEKLLQDPYLLFSSLILKKENLGNLRFNSKFRYISDYEFEVSLAEKYKFHIIKDPLTKYRMHNKNALKIDNIRLLRENLLMRIYFLDKYGNQVPKKLKWYLIFRVIKAYLILGMNKNARYYVMRLFRLYPFNLLNYMCLAQSLIKRDRIINGIRSVLYTENMSNNFRQSSIWNNFLFRFFTNLYIKYILEKKFYIVAFPPFFLKELHLK